jgi:hypothetical protein
MLRESVRRRETQGMSAGIGLPKDMIRQIALTKLAVAYRDWGFDGAPFADFATEPGERREDARAFIIALVAALLGGLSDAIAQNNEAIAVALGRRPRRHVPRRRSAHASRRPPHRR